MQGLALFHGSNDEAQAVGLLRGGILERNRMQTDGNGGLVRGGSFRHFVEVGQLLDKLAPSVNIVKPVGEVQAVVGFELGPKHPIRRNAVDTGAALVLHRCPSGLVKNEEGIPHEVIRQTVNRNFCFPPALRQFCA